MNKNLEITTWAVGYPIGKNRCDPFRRVGFSGYPEHVEGAERACEIGVNPGSAFASRTPPVACMRPTVASRRPIAARWPPSKIVAIRVGPIDHTSLGAAIQDEKVLLQQPGKGNNL